MSNKEKRIFSDRLSKRQRPKPERDPDLVSRFRKPKERPEAYFFGEDPLDRMSSKAAFDWALDREGDFFD